MPDTGGKRKEAHLLLVTNDKLADEAIIAYLKKARQHPENIAFIDDEGKTRSGWSIDLQSINPSLETLLYEKRFDVFPFIDDGTSLPIRWNFLGNRKKVAKNIMKAVQERLAGIVPRNKM